MHPFVNLALRAARDASELLAQQVDRLDRISVLPSADGRLLTSADKDADRTILYHLQKAYPTHGFHSRVSGITEGKDASVMWYIDPLVGGANFLRGLPGFLVSIACQVEGKMKHAVMIDPLLDEEFTATRGGSALLNNRRMRVSDAEQLEGGVMAMDLPETDTALATHHRLTQLALTGKVRTRSSGCAALDVLYVAAGRLDAGWSPHPDRLSLAAAGLILQEAGGLLSGTDGSPTPAPDTDIVFGNPRCFKQLLKSFSR